MIPAGRGPSRVGLLMGSILGLAAVFEPSHAAESPDEIRAREEILFEGRAMLGKLHGADADVDWGGSGVVGTLLLTPTTLYWRELMLSYSTIASARLAPVHTAGFWPGRRKPPKDRLVIQEDRGVCAYGCVLSFLGEEDADDLARRVASIIESHAPRVDPFGRTDGPRPVWLASGLRRQPPPIWTTPPGHLAQHHPGARGTIDILMQDFATNLEKHFPGLLSAALERAFATAPSGEPRFEFVRIDGIEADGRGQINRGNVLKATGRQTRKLNSLLACDPQWLELTELVVPPENRVSISLTFVIDNDFYDLDPPKNGASHRHRFAVEHSLTELLEDGGRVLAESLQAAAEDTAMRIRAAVQPRTSNKPAGAEK